MGGIIFADRMLKTISRVISLICIVSLPLNALAIEVLPCTVLGAANDFYQSYPCRDFS